MTNGLEPARQRPENREKRAVNEDDFVFGMTDDVRNLFRKESDVECVQHASAAWNREVQLEMSSGVPSKGSYPPAIGYLEYIHGPAKAPRAIRPLSIRHALHLAMSRSRDPAGRKQPLGPVKDMWQGQWIILHEPLHVHLLTYDREERT
jgi:hypothetical protein